MERVTRGERIVHRVLQFTRKTRRLPILLSYTITLGLMVVLSLLHNVLLGSDYPFVLLNCGVLLSALLFDRGAGYFAVLLVVVGRIFDIDRGVIHVTNDPIDVLPLACFVFGGALISLITQTLVHLSETLTDNLERMKRVEAYNTIMMRDIHHRVKNHLHSIADLINLSKKKVKDAAGRRELETTANRMFVLARVYDRLQFDQEDMEANVCIQDFFGQLCHDLTLGVIDGRPILIHQTVERHSVPVNTAVALGLLANEVISNSLKHAFPDDRPGNVYLDFARTFDGRLSLRISDDGIGYDPEEMARSVGTRLIETLSTQLSGELTRESAAGAGSVMKLVFPD